MEMRMERIDRREMVYLRRTGPYGPENYKLMAALKDWAVSNGLMGSGSVIYGIAWDSENTPPEQCRYDVCLVAAGDLPHDKAVSMGEIPGGEYVIFTIAHTAQAVQAFWGGVFTEVEKAGCVSDSSRPILERYDYDLVEQGFCEFCVPVLQGKRRMGEKNV